MIACSLAIVKKTVIYTEKTKIAKFITYMSFLVTLIELIMCIREVRLETFDTNTDMLIYRCFLILKKRLSRMEPV
jgi:hypothetical protein